MNNCKDCIHGYEHYPTPVYRCGVIEFEVYDTDSCPNFSPKYIKFNDMTREYFKKLFKWSW